MLFCFLGIVLVEFGKVGFDLYLPNLWCEVFVGPAYGVPVGMAKLLRDHDQRRSGLH